MKKILGLDLGTNSIGWSLLEALVVEHGVELKKIDMAGSRIIPMDAAILGDFDKGNSKSQTAERTRFRGIHRLRERHLLRRERLHRILNIMGFLPQHYLQSIDFDKHPGKFITNNECKLPWKMNANGTYDFIFQTSFSELLADFTCEQPQLVAKGKKVPYDWVLYYLRKKALTHKISKEELAWIILNFNQKRGYYQLRGEDEETEQGKSVEFHALKVVDVKATDQKKGKEIWYNIYLENGWIYRRSSNVPLDWVGKTKEFIVTTELDENRVPKTDKEGSVKRSLRVPNEDDWTLIKKKTETDIERSNKTIGVFIYETLLQSPNQKIRGNLIRTIERKYYKKELITILNKQKEYHSELKDNLLLNKCIQTLYPNNEAHYNNLAGMDFTHLIVNDVIFYQRPLKSKKSEINDCSLEAYRYIDPKTKEEKTKPIKCISKSNPFYQEFRLWQFISNLRIYQREKEVNGKLCIDEDVTEDFLKNQNDYATLFDWMNEKKEIKQDTLLQSYFKIKKIKGQEKLTFRWNYVEDKSYPCNETRAILTEGLEKAGISTVILSKELEYNLWHILYSVEDKYEIIKALNSFKEKYQLPESFVNTFKKLPSFKKEYGSYSEKAIKKLLTLIRQGHHWNPENIDKQIVLPRINNIITGEYDENIQIRVREKATRLTELIHFQGLPVWLASYIIYNRHSEAQEIIKWQTPQEMDNFIKTFKQHSLHNPIVEQVILETLRTVRDIWKKVEHIDEIHIELGREMKNPKDRRKQISDQVLENENTNLRIKRLLAELINPEYNIDNVRPNSPMQQDILRIYEEYALNDNNKPEYITDIIMKFKESDQKKQPSKAEIMRYKLWLEQKYRSPYTGEIIPLGKLFTPAYEIEHIIPQSRYFDDSLSNKVICEAEVNKLKSNQLGYEFIQKHHGQIVSLSLGKSVRIFSVCEYEEFIKQNYSGSGKLKQKKIKLLLDEIPESFIQRQLNDSRYISKIIKGLLSNIVRENNEQEAISKNVITCTGGITDRLKKDWGIYDIWNDLILHRFKRLNSLTGTNSFTVYNEKHQKEIPTMPLELQKGFNKKRIDHRHHAMDAIIIACANRNIVNYLNNESASKHSKIARSDLQRLLCDKVYTDSNGNYSWQIKKPWDTFTQDTRETLNNIIVSFKQNLRVINKTTNHYQHYNDKGKKITDEQVKGDSWAIRKPMHKDTVFGNVNLRKIKFVKISAALNNPIRIVDQILKKKILYLLSLNYDNKKIEKYFKENVDMWKNYNFSKIDIYYFSNETNTPLVASRKPLDISFTIKKIEESVTDTGIQKILLKHLNSYNGNTELAFSPDGIDEMNRNIKELNNGKSHQPIQKVRIYEPQGSKFSVGTTGNRKDKYVEAAKGTNLFFAIYQTESGMRTYDTIPLNIVIENLKQGYPPVPKKNKDGNNLLFWLSPNDLVYIPTEDEIENEHLPKKLDNERIYKMVSCTGNEGHFIPSYIANPILQAIELGSNNKAQRGWNGEMIKEICIPLNNSRLDNFTIINTKKFYEQH